MLWFQLPRISSGGEFQPTITTQLPPCPRTPEAVSGRQTGTRSFWDKTPLPLSGFRVRLCYFWHVPKVHMHKGVCADVGMATYGHPIRSH